MSQGLSVGIVGYKMGNIMSLMHAFESLNVPVFVAATPEALHAATHIVLPGVGAFPIAMEQLERLGFRKVLDDLVLMQKRPLLGVCLGMQLLASSGEEHRLCEGLNYIPGRVVRFQLNDMVIPHMGWNDTRAERPDTLIGDVGAQGCFYFVHSFHFKPEQQAHSALTSDYGGLFVAGVQKDNIYGVQFHPEKSHAAGIALLKRFTEVGRGA